MFKQCSQPQGQHIINAGINLGIRTMIMVTQLINIGDMILLLVVMEDFSNLIIAQVPLSQIASSGIW